jgi:hypothetical protein
VLPLTKLSTIAGLPLCDQYTDVTIKILLLLLDGVIEADIPVSVKLVEVLLAVSVLVDETT